MILLKFGCEFTYVLDRVRGVTIQQKKVTNRVFKGKRNWLGMKKLELEENEEFILAIYGDLSQPNGSMQMVTYTVAYDEYKRAKKDYEDVFLQLKKQIPNLVDEAFDNLLRAGE